LASPELKVTGVDFSEGQIKIARSKAIETRKVNCDYLQMDINRMGDCFRSNQFDGAFIHCGIHHLSSAELNEFADLLAQSPKGFPTILVEPAYLDRAHKFGRLLGHLLARLTSLIRRLCLAHSSQDKAVKQSTERLIRLATDNGWFLSPKEMPFDVREIRNVFSHHFEIKEIAPVTHFGLDAAQYLATLEDQDLASKIAARVLPVLNLIDRCLIKTGLLPTITTGYLFCRIVLIRK
jgi:SAM-dependent methyltransferase